MSRRAARDQARDKVQAGIDPADEKREAKLALLIAQESSFEAVARAWHARWSTGRHARYAEDVMSRLERNVFPVLGHKPVDQIEAKHVVAMMERVQGRGATDVARRVRNTCSQVFRYAITRGLCSRNPASEFKPSDVLPQRSSGNHARIDEGEPPQLLRKIEAYEGSQLTRLAMKLRALTFVRTSELIEAKWDEIDFDAAEWRIPAERMKMKRLHVVPLAPQAIQVLRTLQVISRGSELLFPGERDRKKPMSNNTILKALERLGYKGKMTGHGFRGNASTALYERQFASDHIELQLAHVRGKVRGAYDHSRQLPQRRKMMEFWQISWVTVCGIARGRSFLVRTSDWHPVSASGPDTTVRRGEWNDRFRLRAVGRLRRSNDSYRRERTSHRELGKLGSNIERCPRSSGGLHMRTLRVQATLEGFKSGGALVRTRTGSTTCRTRPFGVCASRDQ